MLWVRLIHKRRRLVRIYASIYYFLQRDWNFWVRTDNSSNQTWTNLLSTAAFYLFCNIFYNLYTLLVRICIELSASTLVSDKSYRKIRNSLQASSSFIAIEARRDSSQVANALGSSLACCCRVTSLLLPQIKMESLLDCRLDHKGLLAQCGSGTFRIRSGLLNNKLHVRRVICVHERLPWSV